MKALKLAALYLALVLGANAQGADVALEGDMRKLNLHDAPKAVPEIALSDAEGGSRNLDEYAGKHVLVNFWATWCAPCREEMPSLSALQSEMGGDGFEVVTVATGRNTVDGIARFFDEIGVSNLPVLIDDGSLARGMGVLGLPITVILDPAGREIARLQGDADWAAPEAQDAIAAITGGAE